MMSNRLHYEGIGDVGPLPGTPNNFPLAPTGIDLATHTNKIVETSDLVNKHVTGRVKPEHSFSNFNSDSSSFIDVIIENISLDLCDYKDTSLRRCYLFRCNITNASHANNYYEETLFSECYFKNSAMQYCHFERSVFEKCDLDNLLIKSCQFINCLFIDCNTESKVFETSIFKNCIFKRTIIQLDVVKNNFGIHKNDLVEIGQIRVGRKRHKHSFINISEVGNKEWSNGNFLEKLNLAAFIRNGDLATLEEMDDALNSQQWLIFGSFPGLFAENMNQFTEFLMSKFNDGEVGYLPVMMFNAVAGDLIEAISGRAEMSRAAQAAAHARQLTARYIEVYSNLISKAFIKSNFLATITLHGNIPQNEDSIREILFPLLSDKNSTIMSIGKKNSPYEIKVKFLSKDAWFYFCMRISSVRADLFIGKQSISKPLEVQDKPINELSLEVIGASSDYSGGDNYSIRGSLEEGLIFQLKNNQKLFLIQAQASALLPKWNIISYLKIDIDLKAFRRIRSAVLNYVLSDDLTAEPMNDQTVSV